MAEQTYTEPELRERLKQEIQAGDRGGRKGQWSARKSQLLVGEYERAGGGYVDEGHLTPSQQHLQQWGDQDWRTASGDTGARDGDGTARYLPDVAWQLLSPSEREATDRRKKGSDEQHVANTDAAKEARDAAELRSGCARWTDSVVGARGRHSDQRLPDQRPTGARGPGRARLRSVVGR